MATLIVISSLFQFMLAARLSIGKNLEKGIRPVESIFRLIGKDEDALTYALGFLLAHDPDFCVEAVFYAPHRHNADQPGDGYETAKPLRRH